MDPHYSMPSVSALELLRERLQSVLGSTLRKLTQSEHGEIAIELRSEDYLDACRLVRDEAGLRFDTCIDLCGIDYSTYQLADSAQGPRYAVVLHLLSTELNQRVRLKVFADDDAWPRVPSLIEVWPSVNWYEREAFDLYGILFEGHPDLRRILTDYGFIGHPFRKDFPLSGNVEMRYDPDQKRVIYQPVTIEPRELTPRVIREPGYGAGR